MERILMEHGSGGASTGQLIHEIFENEFNNPVLSMMEDAAVIPGSSRIAMTTDSFVVTPLEFPGGDIGRLCVCGTVNDLLMRGARPKYMTCGFILEEGAEIALLKRLVKSMAATAREAGITVVAGDTKVIEGKGGIYINTTGVGFVPEGIEISAGQAKAGDLILASGYMGDHHATILSQRMGISNSLESDNAPLTEMVEGLLDKKIPVHTLRDVTRGGLATVLKELAVSCGQHFIIREKDLPVNPQVKDFCGLMGLDPLYMGNEGKMIAILPEEAAREALAVIKNSRYGQHAVLIGRVEAPAREEEAGLLTLETRIGGRRSLGILQGEGLPRIC